MMKDKVVIITGAESSNIETPLVPSEYRQEFIDETPAGRLATPENIANMILFLSSDKASYVTGKTIKVDGG